VGPKIVRQGGKEGRRALGWSGGPEKNGPREMDAGGGLGHGLVPGRLSPPFFSFLFISFCKSFPKRILNINK